MNDFGDNSVDSQKLINCFIFRDLLQATGFWESYGDGT